MRERDRECSGCTVNMNDPGADRESRGEDKGILVRDGEDWVFPMDPFLPETFALVRPLTVKRRGKGLE